MRQAIAATLAYNLKMAENYIYLLEELEADEDSEVREAAKKLLAKVRPPF